MKKSKFLDSLMDKDVGSSPVAFHFFLLSFKFANFFVIILAFVYTWIYFFESGICLFNKYTHIKTYIISISRNNSLHAG